MIPSIVQRLSKAALDYHFSSPAVVSFVGAGGKTATLYLMAEGLKQMGHTVMVTTTTKIFHPEVEGRAAYQVFTGSVEKLIEEFDGKATKTIVAARRFDEASSKLVGYSVEELEILRKEAMIDFIFVEADGAQRKSIKAPANHEPVISGETNLVVGLLGLDSLGKVLNDQNVHRPEHFSECTGLKLDERITPLSVFSLVFQEKGLFKNAPASSRKWLILNKADNGPLKSEGEELAKEIIRENHRSGLIDRVFITSLKEPGYFKEVSKI